MKIGIIGMGFVGGTTAKVLGKIHDILPYDKYKDIYKNPKKLLEAEVIFLCVPTPMYSNGKIDYSYIYDSLKILTGITSELRKKPLVVVRSTVVSGTTDMLESKYPFHFVFNPEFLREKHALKDMNNTNRIIIGANREEDYQKVKSVYKPLFPNVKYIKTNRKTAEMIKYASNVMLAGQIALANEIYQICKYLNIKYDKIKEVLLMDNRIARNIDVPGPDKSLGFGGKCFPKDLNALIYLAKKQRYKPHLLEEVWKLNKKVRKNKDWTKIKGATSKKSFDKN